MNYLFNEGIDSITNRICNIKGINKDKLDVSNFWSSHDSFNELTKLDVYNNFSSLKSKEVIPFISEEQIYYRE